MMNHSKRSRQVFYKSLLAIIVLIANTNLFAQSVSDSLLKEQLTRAVQSWKAGQALPAYQALDSITSQPLTPENASSKVKAAIWSATYLQEQKKLKPAAKFLDSAMVWASQYEKGDGLRRSYEAYAAWHVASGNLKSAMSAQAQATTIKDSLSESIFQHSMDSMKSLISDLQNKLNKPAVVAAPVKTETAPSNNDNLVKILGVSIFILLLVIFLMNGKISRLNSAPPAPLKWKDELPKQETQRSQVKKADTETKTAELITEQKTTAAPVITEKQKVAADNKVKEVSKNVAELTARLSAVELILIRSDIFSEKVNGESKVAARTLQKYSDDFPAMMKRLDDAIANNDADAILKSIAEFKPSLETFGMNPTLIWIHEIEAEAPEAKVNKLLSRVFQVRNHVRRALDEAKAILEKVSL